MSLLIERALLLVKSEVTYGVDPIPTGADDVVIAEEVSLALPVEVIDQMPRAKGHMSQVKPLHGRKLAELTFNVPIKGSGTPGTPPEFDPLLQACGLQVTNAPGTSDTYTPAQDPNDLAQAPSCTIYWHVDGLLYKLLGCHGTVTWDFSAGMRGMLNFTMTGLPEKVEDAAVPAVSGIDPTDAPIVKSASFSFGGFAEVIQQLAIDSQNEVTAAESVNGANAYARIDITMRNYEGSINPEAQLVATRDHWDLWETNTSQALSITLGSAAGNICTVNAPACHIRELNPADRAQIYTYDVPISLSANSDGGNDEIEMVFT